MVSRVLLAVGAGWVLPGLGHLVLGRASRALYFGLLVLVTFGLGLWLGEGASVSADRFPYHWYGQVLAGAPALLADATIGARATGRTIDRLEVGVVFTTVAGLLNLIVVIDAYFIARTGRSDG